jgi:hypothetical protein
VEEQVVCVWGGWVGIVAAWGVVQHSSRSTRECCAAPCPCTESGNCHAPRGAR